MNPKQREPQRRQVLTLGLTLAAAATGALPSAVQAQASTWPSKQAIRWVVAYPAGGGSDFLARQLAPQLSKQLGQSLIIENKPGAAGIIGTETAARAAGDGYTMVSGDNGVMVFHGAMYKKLPYDPKDLVPVGFMARFPLILAVHPNAGFSNAKQWLDLMKTNPGKYTYASPGIGSPHHLAMELLKDRSQTFIVHVPYRGTAFALQDVLGGVVPMTVVDTAAGLPQIRAGKLKALAVMSKRRLPSLPDVPTFEELGFKDLEVTAWQGLFMPKGTAPEIVARLGGELSKALNTPEVKARLEDFGLEVAPSGSANLANFVQSETVFWHKLIRERKLSAE